MAATLAGDTQDVRCPLCQSDGAEPQRALRSSAIYFCRDCGHEWEVEGDTPLSRQA